MEEVVFKIINNVEIAKNIYKMQLSGNTSAIKNPGQFVNIKIDDLYLRRPISICDYTDNSLTLIYKVVGEGTDKLSKLSKGELNLLIGLGNGYDVSKSGQCPLLIGGGVGVPPLYNLAKVLIKQGKEVSVILGFNTKEEVFYEKEFLALGAKTYVTTVDGSYGHKGFVTAVMDKLAYSYFYTCGPMPMLKAVYDISKSDGELSFEERMGCGFGVCMGCSCRTKYGNKRICKDGPVLSKEEVIW